MFAQAASFCASAAWAILCAVSTSGVVTSAVMHWAGGIMEKLHHVPRGADKGIQRRSVPPPPALGLRVWLAFGGLLLLVVVDEINTARRIERHRKFIVGLEAIRGILRHRSNNRIAGQLCDFGHN